MFDVAEPGRERAEPRRFWQEGEDWLICGEASEQAGERVLTRRLVVFRRAGERWRRSDELHTLHLYEREEILGELDAAGFDAQLLDGYAADGRFAARGHAGFAAIKPRSPRA